MCNACHNVCCGSGMLGGCGCDGCDCPECWSDDDDHDDDMFLCEPIDEQPPKKP